MKTLQRDPSLAIADGDIFDFNPDEQSYDRVLMSGVLNEPLQDNGHYLHSPGPDAEA